MEHTCSGQSLSLFQPTKPCLQRYRQKPQSRKAEPPPRAASSLHFGELDGFPRRMLAHGVLLPPFCVLSVQDTRSHILLFPSPLVDISLNNVWANLFQITHRRCSYLPGHTVTSHRTAAPDIETPVGDLLGQTLHTNGRPRGVFIGKRSCGIRRRVMECELVTAPTCAEASRMPSGTATMGTSSTTGVSTETTHSRWPCLR